MKTITEQLTELCHKLTPLVENKWPANVYVAAVLNGEVAAAARMYNTSVDHAMQMQIPYILGNITHIRGEGMKEIRAELKKLNLQRCK